MKKILHVLILSLMAFPLVAQPTLTSSDWFDVGDVLSFREVPAIEGVDPGASGADVTWDFSSLATGGFHGSSGFALDPSEGLWNDSFPDATVMRDYINGSDVYFKKNMDSLVRLGSVSVNVFGDTIINKSIDNSLRYLFPANYLDAFTDISTINKTGVFERTIDINVNIDGYGTLITPIGTYENVLRAFREENTSTFVISTGATVLAFTRIYAWFNSDIGELMTIVQTQDELGNWVNTGIHLTTDVVPEPCTADAGTLTADADTVCMDMGEATLSATENGDIEVPSGYDFLYVLTSGSELVIQETSLFPTFTVSSPGLYTIHTLVYNPNPLNENFLDLSVIEPGVTTGGDVLDLVASSGICASLDAAGAPVTVLSGDDPYCVGCTANAGTLTAVNSSVCMADGEASISATPNGDIVIPEDYTFIYVLTSGTGLVIENVGAAPEFTVSTPGLYTIHTLVYTDDMGDPDFLDLTTIEIGVTTGVDVLNLLSITGICASLDAAGAPIDVLAGDDPACICSADAGTLTTDESPVCISGGEAAISASPNGDAVVPTDYSTLFVLTSGVDLVIEATNSSPDFTVSTSGDYTIHTLIYNDDDTDPNYLDLSVVVPGTTTGVDVLDLIASSGICASLDAAGAAVEVLAEDDPACFVCTADAGTLTIDNALVCIKEGDTGEVAATPDGAGATIPAGYSSVYVLTSGEDLVIEQTGTTPVFTVSDTNTYTVHTLVYTDDSGDPNFLDLSVVVPGTTTGADVAGIISTSGICASLDVAGASAVVRFEGHPDCPVGIFDEPVNEVINIYPNPATDFIRIDLSSDEFIDGQVRVINQLGQLMLTTNLEIPSGVNTWFVDVSDLSTGIYFLNISSGDQSLTQRFVVE